MPDHFSSTATGSLAPVGSTLAGIATGYLPAKNLTINRAENGWIINCVGFTYVEHTWIDAVERMRTLLGEVK